MTLSEALDIVYGPGANWANPIRPYFVTGCDDSPYEAYLKLKPESRAILKRLIGHEPKPDEQ